MIGKISGRVDHVGADWALIEAGGVGYVVHCAPATLATLPSPGGTASLYTELVVREDLMQLLGFRSLAEREWHRLLTSVQGVGAKAALSILGALGSEGVARAIGLGDVTAIRMAPGVGPKLAARVVNELADKAAGLAALAPGLPAAAASGVAPGAAASAPGRGGGSSGAAADALSALVNLGYERMEAARAIAEAVEAGDGAGAAQLIRAALRRLAPAL